VPEKSRPCYPLFLDLENRGALVVGGGSVAVRKVESLMRSGARVTVVAPECADEIEQWGRDGAIELRRKHYDRGDLNGAVLVIAATSDAPTNARVASDCREERILVNVVDLTAMCDFIVPAVVESGSIQVAVSTGGQSPALARKLKHDLQRLVGPEYGEANDILGNLRDAAKSALPTDADRKQFFDRLIAAGLVELLRENRRREAYETALGICESAGVPAGDFLRRRLMESSI
jgi:siroheme synthase-like protein